jgi:pimeloyl-ACP methyl ester carboxylesterase
MKAGSGASKRTVPRRHPARPCNTLTPFLKAFLDRYAQHATMIEIQATGHWIPEERPVETAAAILEFIGQP